MRMEMKGTGGKPADISKIRAGLLQLNPFWGYLLAQTPVKIMKTAVGTSYTDGKRVVLHEEQVRDEKEAMKILLHELAHIGYMHVARRKETYAAAIGEEIPDIVANLGEDVIANATVVDVFGEEIDGAAVRVPEGTRGERAIILMGGKQVVVKFPKRIGEMTTEEIVKAVWEKLKQEFPQIGQASGGKGQKGEGDGRKKKGGEDGSGGSGKNGKEGDLKVNGWTDDHSKHGEVSDADKDEIRQRIEKAIEHATKNRGKVPAGIGAVIEAMKPKVAVNWKLFARKWIRETWGRDDYTWKRPNKRKLAATNVYLPRTVGYQGEAWIVLDTSGSMMGDDIKKAIGTIQKGMTQNGIDMANIVQCDATVEKVDRVRAKDLNKYEIVGMGGTVLRPAIEYAVKKGARGVIVITDGLIDVSDVNGWKVPILVMVTDKEGYNLIRGKTDRNVKVVYVE